MADTVRLIDSEERNAGTAEAIENFGAAKLLRRQEDELNLALFDAVENFLMFAGGKSRVDDGRFIQAGGLDGVRLVLLQRDQGGDDHGRAVKQAAGDLVDRRFS